MMIFPSAERQQPMSTLPVSDNTAKHSLSTRTSLVISGNAYIDGARQRGWFIGHFLGETCGLRSTPSLEVKWSVPRAGEEKAQWGVSKSATTLCLLIKGRVSIRFPMTECILSHEGDYVIWSAGIPHRWMVAEDALVLTIRWPSTAGDYCEQVQSKMTNVYERH
jgi:hypothetical protein